MGEHTAGVLLLETSYMDAVGGMSNPETYSFPVVRRWIGGARTNRVVGGAGDLTDAYAEGAEEVRDAGVDVVAANCGFSVDFQDAVARASGLPTITSALLLGPLLHRIFSGRLGVLTFDATALSRERLVGAGWSDDMMGLPVADVGDSEAWQQMRLPTKPELDHDAMRADTVAAARSLVERGAEAILVECTAMIPFEDDVRREVQVPTFSLVGFLEYLVGQLP